MNDITILALISWGIGTPANLRSGSIRWLLVSLSFCLWGLGTAAVKAIV